MHRRAAGEFAGLPGRARTAVLVEPGPLWHRDRRQVRGPAERGNGCCTPDRRRSGVAPFKLERLCTTKLPATYPATPQMNPHSDALRYTIIRCIAGASQSDIIPVFHGNRLLSVCEVGRGCTALQTATAMVNEATSHAPHNSKPGECPQNIIWYCHNISKAFDQSLPENSHVNSVPGRDINREGMVQQSVYENGPSPIPAA